jgi:hypothetical protein
LKFNVTILTRSIDTGAQVWLVPAAQVAALAAAASGTTDEPIPQQATGWDTKLTEQFKFPHTLANDRGEFAFADAAPGSYTLVMLSKHSNGLAARDRGGKMRFKDIVVREGKTLNVKYNFGMSALPKGE